MIIEFNSIKPIYFFNQIFIIINKLNFLVIIFFLGTLFI
jgi:hypothetical protein